jgi:hypothetical protein
VLAPTVGVYREVYSLSVLYLSNVGSSGVAGAGWFFGTTLRHGGFGFPPKNRLLAVVIEVQNSRIEVFYKELCSLDIFNFKIE